MFRSITSLNNKIIQNNNGSVLEKPDNVEIVQTNYISIGKLAKNAKIKAEEVLFLMQPKGLLDVSVLDSRNTDLKKAISQKTKKNAYTKTKEELEELSNGTNSTGTKFQDAKLKKAFGHIADLFERSLEFKKFKLTGLDSFPKLNDFCRTIMKSNWRISLKNVTTIEGISDAKRAFLTSILDTIKQTELYKSNKYKFVKGWLAILSPDESTVNIYFDNLKIIYADPLSGEKNNKLISAAAAHINKCIEKAQQKCQKLEEAIKNRDNNVENFINDIENGIPAESLPTTYASGYNYSIFLKMIKNHLGRKSKLFPYYKRLNGGKKLVEAVDKLEQNFEPKEGCDNRNAIKEFRENLTDVNFTNKEDCFVKGFNKFKEKYALKN